MSAKSIENPRRVALKILKIGAPAFFIIAFVYFLVIPMMWPFFKPTISISVPKTWKYDQDMKISIKVRAMHSNFVIQQVRITYPYNASNPEQTPYPQVLYSESSPREWSIWKISRFTRPASREVNVTVPLERLVDEGKVVRGRLAGNIQVNVDYIRGIGPHYALAGKIRSFTLTKQIPYSITLE